MSVSTIKSFENLDVWQIGKKLTIDIYRLTQGFPKDEVFGLTSQLRRAALSVPANIAEGFGRYHYLDKAKFYLNARGSLNELKSHLLISNELEFINKANFNDALHIIDDLGIRLNNLIKKPDISRNLSDFLPVSMSISISINLY